MRPQVRADLYVAELDEGAYLLTYDGGTTLPVPGVMAWLTQVLPRLDGTTTLADLTIRLAPDRAETVRRLVCGLAERGIVFDVDGARPADDPQAHALLARSGPAGLTSLARYRDAHVVVVGTEPLAEHLYDAVRRSGVQRVEHIAFQPVLMRSMVASSLALHVSRPEAEALSELDAQPAQVAHVLIDGSQVWRLPIGTPLGSLWNTDPLWDWTDEPSSTDDAADPTALHVAANQVAHGVLRDYCSIQETTQRTHRAVRIDLRTLRSSTHRIEPRRHRTAHPARGPSAVRTARRRMMAARRPSDAEFSRQAISYVDERTGVLRRLDERDLAQEPLHLCETVPAGCEPVFGVGLTFAAARIRAARRGLVCHAVATANRSAPAWGYRLADGKPLPLNPQIAYPRDAHPPGISDGVDYSDALARTLAEHATLLTVTEAVHPLIDHGVLELAAAHLDDEGAQYRRMIDILRIDLAIHDITSQLGVPTLAFSIGDKVVCCAGAPRMRDVLRRGLRRVLLAHQARIHRQPEYAPPLVTALTGRSWSAATAPAPPDLVGAPDAQVSALIGAGYQPVVVPLDHDPKLRRLVPCLLRTVLLR